MRNNQRMIDAIRAILGLGPLYAPDGYDPLRHVRAQSGGFTDGNYRRQAYALGQGKVAVSHGGTALRRAL